MRIRRIRDITGAVSGLAVLVIVVLLAWAFQQEFRAVESHRKAIDINKGASELRYLAFDTVIHNERRSQEQWQAKYEELTATLARIQLDPAQQNLLEQLRREHANMGVLYPRLIQYHEAAALAGADGARFRELQSRAASRLFGASHQLLSDTFRLMEASHADIAAAQRNMALFTAVFVVLLCAIVFGNWVLISRIVLGPVERLQQGTAAFAAGNLGHRMGVSDDNELGKLGRAFDAMAETIQAATRDLQRSNAELEQFAYVASHDLQEPLRMVSSYVQLLEKRYKGRLDDRADKYIHYAVDGAKRMSALIRDVLDLSRVGTRGKPLVPVDAGAALGNALRNLERAVEDAGAEVEPGPLPTVRADAGQLELLFQNLVGNALKFRGADPPRVRVIAERGEGEWIFTVADNGIGIAPEYHDRIFRIFQRLHSAQKYPGTGIGLAICRKIVERHRGRIWVEAGHDCGSSFRFTLPD